MVAVVECGNSLELFLDLLKPRPFWRPRFLIIAAIFYFLIIADMVNFCILVFLIAVTNLLSFFIDRNRFNLPLS